MKPGADRLGWGMSTQKQRKLKHSPSPARPPQARAGALFCVHMGTRFCNMCNGKLNAFSETACVL